MSAVDCIELDDLNPDQRELAELIGIANYRVLIKTYGGFCIYIPKSDAFEKNDRNEKIRSEFNGYNFRQLAIKYELTEVTIRRIVADITDSIRSRPITNQLSIFDAK